MLKAKLLKSKAAYLNLIMVFAFLFAIPADGIGQDVMVLTLEDALQIALTQSYNIKTSRTNFEISDLGRQLSLANQKTSTRLSFNLPSYNQSIREIPTPTGNVYRNDKTISTNANLSITQPLRWTNSDLSLTAGYTTSNQYSENNGKITETHRWTDSFRLRLTQPLFQPNTKMMEFESSMRDFDYAEKSYEGTENGIWGDVLSAYYGLVRSKRNLEIDEKDFENSRFNFETAQNKYAAGILAEVQMMENELTFKNAENSFEQQKLNYSKAKDNFKRLIGLEQDQEIDVPAEEGIEIQFINIDAEIAKQKALENSLNLLRSRNSLIDQKNNIRVTQAQDKIQANLSGSYGLNESDPFAEFWRGDWSWTDELFKDFTQTNSLGLSLNIPIWDSGRRKIRTQRSELQLELSEKAMDYAIEQLDISVQQNLEDLNNARVRIELQSGNVELAQRTYDINLEKFNLGDISTNDLDISNQRLKSAQLNILNARIDYLAALSRLYQTTFWDFENDCPLNETVKQYITGR
ncbi:TolC family protein [candidate division KSB1 bacterium]